MIRYFRARLSETSTRFGLALIALAALLAGYEWRVALGHAALFVLGSVFSSLPDALLRHVWPLIEAAADLPEPTSKIKDPQNEPR